MAQVLQQAATVTTAQDGSYEMLDYVISLREGIMDAWGGIILGLKAGGKSTLTTADDDSRVGTTVANCPCSPTSPALRGDYFPTPEHRLQ